MNNIESQSDPTGRSSFAWLPTAVFVVFVLALSWTGVFVVVSDLIAAAASSTISSTVDAVRE